jgi:hypothetical protein
MAEYPYGISGELTEDERARLEAVTIDLGYGNTRTAADLVVGWAAHVTRLSQERHLRPPADRDAWNAHDYVASLVVRGFTQRALDHLDEHLQSRVVRTVTRFDELLLSFTEPDARGLLRRFAGEDADDRWWWDRIPTSGPVHDELLRFGARLGL